MPSKVLCFFIPILLIAKGNIEWDSIVTTPKAQDAPRLHDEKGEEREQELQENKTSEGTRINLLPRKGRTSAGKRRAAKGGAMGGAMDRKTKRSAKSKLRK